MQNTNATNENTTSNGPTLKEYLQLFDLIITKGSKTEDLYEFEGLTAWHDLDGYTCFIKYNDLTLTLLFHGRYFFDYQEEETMKQFVKKHKKLMLLTE